jgi:hypothetical protein
LHKKHVYVLVQFEYQVKSLESLCFKLLLQVAEVGRLAASTKKVEIELKKAEGTGSIEEAKLRQQQKENLIKSRERTLNLIKSSLDILVAAGLLKLAPRTITPRITGALGFITSAISCYQLLPTPPKAKSS